ncbi:hypothetical protein HCJ88_08905 [Lacticaseibacillus paracasei]|uniref:Uncharacterized protein n=1 Tax=Lacticaseibacillus paracasei TaxID=1597 RepID=A0ABD7BMP3_LACPA|nr:hypothetical protein HCJ88_08905 [Lacticaseibacillus paracasei]
MFVTPPLFQYSYYYDKSRFKHDQQKGWLDAENDASSDIQMVLDRGSAGADRDQY